MKKTAAVCLSALLALTGIIHSKTEIRAEGPAENTVRIIFTGELYDHISPFKQSNEEGNAQLFGGYAHILTKMEEYKGERTVLVDAGNFSRGTCYEALNTRKAPDLTMMSIMGYDAVNIGSDDVSVSTQDFTDMLKTAEDSPLLLSANMQIGSSAEAADLKEEWKAKGKDCTIVEKDGVRIGIFGIAAEETYGDFVFAEAASSAETAVKKLKNDGADVTICLLADGNDALDEAVAASGADVIVSPAGGRRLEEPVEKNGALIVSCGQFGKDFGVLDYDYKNRKAADYKLVRIASTDIAPHGQIAEKISGYQTDVAALVFAPYGYSWGTETAYLVVPLTDRDGEGNISDFLADAYQESYQRKETDAKPVLSILTKKTGIIDCRGSITVNDLYTALGADLPLIRVYISGKDLRTLCELDYELYKEGIETGIHFGKMRYMYVEGRAEGNKVEDVYVEAVKDYYVPADDAKLYPVVTDSALPGMIARMNARAGKEYVINLCDEAGHPLRDVSSMNIVFEGKGVYPWTAAAAYLRSFERKAGDLPTVENEYKNVRTKRLEDKKFDPVRYFRHFDFTSWKKYGIMALTAVGVIVLLKFIVWLVNHWPSKQS